MQSSKKAAPSTKTFEVPQLSAVTCRVHPVVVMTILDAHVRRQESNDRVIGTLLGSVTEGNIVDITDCYTVLHFDRKDAGSNKAVQLQRDYHDQMLAMKRKVSPKEQVVGWFSSSMELDDRSAALHHFYGSKEGHFLVQPPLLQPVHLCVDASLSSGSLAVKAFQTTPLPVVTESLAQFHEIPLEIHAPQQDKAGLQLLMKAKAAQEDDANVLADGFETGIVGLLDLLHKAATYVEEVESGKRKGDPEIGRFLMKALSSDTYFDLEAFDAVCQNQLQDTLMVVYLSHLTRLQIALAEKINASVQ